MIADIAHELRNPLATLQLRIDALSDGLVHFSADEAELLQGQVALLARLIGDLRTLSLADAGRLTLNRLELDLNDLAANVVRQAQHGAAKVNAALLLRPADEPALVSADEGRLTQVLNNLLSNALRVTPPGGTVEVRLTTTPTVVSLQVRDTGPGIPEDELSRVFERFVQGRRRDTGDTGSGLGLAIVQSLVSLHGGRVRAGNYSDDDGNNDGDEGRTGALLEVSLPRIAKSS